MVSARIIVFLSDFGPESLYVGQVKGILAGLETIDLCHDIPPEDVRAGAYVLFTSYRYYPPGSVFLAVVDPGVGTTRKALVASWRDYFFVAPDNGILSPFMDKDFRAFEIPVPPEASATFHARDVFAPAARRIAMGEKIENLGRACSSPTHCAFLSPRDTGEGLRARIILRDRFGNLITDVPAKMLENRNFAVMAGGKEISSARTYGDVEPGQALALVGSGGFLELSVRDGDASVTLSLSVGDVVEVIWKTK
ncbi:MAG: SAM hydrolase/SAM-dependent halogenase family protein [candidate division WOR-3 bacterium]